MTAERWAQIKGLFESVLNLPDQDRSALLERECGSDHALRSEVERLIKAHETASDFLEIPANRLYMRGPLLSQGELISGRFRIAGFLGSGGMGDVYEAVDEYLDEHIAIKTVRPEISIDPANYDRLLREVTLARRITHPNVCRIFDLNHGESIGGHLTFMTMELLHGETLSERVKRSGPMMAQEALPLLRQVAEGLMSAHSAGVVHRDLKSGNIFLAGSPSSSTRAVITDFGLARAISTSPSAVQSITRNGDVVGTVAYMAPEQVAGGTCTFASDIYSFGIIMLETLTGTRAFPSDPDGCRHDIPMPLREVILRCLQPEADRRFPDGAALAAALANAGLALQDDIPQPGLRAGATASPPRYSRLMIAACVALSFLLALSYLALRLYRHESRIPEGASVLLTEVANDTTDPELTAVTEVLRNELSQSAYLNVVEQGTVQQILREMSKSPSLPLGAEVARETAWRAGAAATVFGNVARLGTDYLLSVRIELTGTEPQSPRSRWIRQFDGASKKDLFDSIQNAAAWIRKTVGEASGDVANRERPPRETTTASWEALKFFAEAEHLKAADRDEDALLILNQALELDSTFVLARMRKADILVHLGKLHDGFREWRLAIDTMKVRRVTLREELRAKGLYALDREDFAAAIEAFKTYRAQFPLDYLPHFYMARPLMMTGRMEEALESLRQAARVNPQSRHMPFHLAMYNIASGNLNLAQNYIQRLLELHENEWADALTASVEFLRGNYGASEQRYDELSNSKDPYWHSQSFLLKACLLSELGRYQAALRALDLGMVYDARTGRDQSRAQKLLSAAYIHFRRNDTVSCRRACLSAAQYEKGVDCLLRAATLLARSGFIREARKLTAEIGMDDAPKFFSARHRALGETLLASRKTRGAIREFQLAATVEPAARDHEPLARALSAAGNGSAAAPLLERIANHPGDIWQAPENEFPGYWADTLFSYGRITRSRSHLQLYLQTRADADPDSPEIAECKQLLRTLQ